MLTEMPLTIYSGGAKGVDTVAEQLCHQYGHDCVIYIPPCHARARPTQPFPPLGERIQPLTYQKLHEAGPFALEASVHLGTRVTDPITQQYVCRNWHIIKDASLVLAFGTIDSMNEHVQGGTGWSVDMAKARPIPIYVFDVKSDTWFWWNGYQFENVNTMSDMEIKPPTLQHHTAIVGTREPTPNVIRELKRLFSSFRP